MIAQRLSILLSVLAMCLMALACSLGWRSEQQAAPPAAVADTGHTGRSLAEEVAQRCRQLDDRFLTCADEVRRAWKPATPAHYPKKVRRLLQIKHRYELETRALRACRGDPEAPAEAAGVQACAGRSACHEFANCVADSFDPFP